MGPSPGRRAALDQVSRRLYAESVTRPAVVCVALPQGVEAWTLYGTEPIHMRRRRTLSARGGRWNGLLVFGDRDHRGRLAAASAMTASPDCCAKLAQLRTGSRSHR